MKFRAPVFLVLLMVIGALSPLLAGGAVAHEAQAVDAGGIVLGDIADFDPAVNGKRYLFVDDDEPLCSTTWLLLGHRPSMRPTLHISAAHQMSITTAKLKSYSTTLMAQQTSADTSHQVCLDSEKFSMSMSMI